MRLLRLDAKNSKWVLEDFTRKTVPLYAILSHTWGCDGDEIKFDDVADGQRAYNDTSKPGYEKLRFCQKLVEKDGLRYFWIDTCCIKKSDGFELQRSLASMFYWYQRAIRCYVWLADVSIKDATGKLESKWETPFSTSRWFERGWTLQELLAPDNVSFFSKEGKFIGDKKMLAATISTVTRIPSPALSGVDLSRFSTEERLSWTKGRITTMPEDSAYCLFGLLDVELPTLYADGEYTKRKAVAMERLQKAVDDKVAVTKQPENIIRIGGASYTDLTTLTEDQLAALDTDLAEFCKWLLDGFPPTYTEKTIGSGETLTKLSHNAGRRLKRLLTKYSVRYDDLSHLDSSVQSWKEPWGRYRNKKATAQKRVQGLLENRWYWTMKHEEVWTGMMAAITLEAIMVWRGTWKR
ncbi:heterokaryon incompatibility protein-domain-containing protein [Ampelomyces quisqualis]|uniref:Heterokaryon incompatibility protein-domain-containing protein n=1 Tax=Ampelomyces quisqualis TaxID=50730 RepID=A0A6A5R0Z1_AMPQU|nr:heterokaryon incompatibility protein-domain-containing protein [Ampelomyces quisqualis]